MSESLAWVSIQDANQKHIFQAKIKTQIQRKKKITSGMSESLAWVSSKLLKVTDVEARSQQLLHLIMMIIIMIIILIILMMMI